jgi:hypothetical protein
MRSEGEKAGCRNAILMMTMALKLLPNSAKSTGYSCRGWIGAQCFFSRMYNSYLQNT